MNFRIFNKFAEDMSFFRFKQRIRNTGRDLSAIIDNTKKINKNSIVSIAPVFNERVRLKKYIEHNLAIGIDHMLFIDNASVDKPEEVIGNYDCCSLFFTDSSYAKAKSGVLWFNYLIHKYAENNWCIFVDIDEHFYYPYCDTRDIHELCHYFEDNNKYSICATMVDLYPGACTGKYSFDRAGYFYFTSGKTISVRGGPRVRCFNANKPSNSPVNIKYPLLKFNKNVFYVASSHLVYPDSLCKAHKKDKIFPTSVIAHYKFDEIFDEKIEEAITRGEHYGNAAEYKIYSLHEQRDFYNTDSQPFLSWHSFLNNGLLTTGDWF